MRNELWLKIGQSNARGNDKVSPILHSTKDRPHPHIFEVSQGIVKSEYTPAPAGDLHIYRHPGQDAKGVSFGLEFAKTRYDSDRNIRKIAVLNHAKNGTGFSTGHWNPGDTWFESSMDFMQAAIEKNPELVPTGILWHGGEIDTGMTQVEYQASMTAMVNEIRSRFGQQIVVVIGTMLESWIQGNESQRRHIDTAHRNMPNILPDTAIADLSGLTDMADFLHFSAASLREAGRIYAASVPETSAKVFVPHKLVNQGGRVYDEYTGGDENSLDGSSDFIVADGKQTNMTLNPYRYTIQAKIQFDEQPASLDYIISGKGFSFGLSGLRHGASSHFTPNLCPGELAEMKVVFYGQKVSLYLRGEWVADAVMTDQLSEPIALALGSPGFPVKFFDLTVLPRA